MTIKQKNIFSMRLTIKLLILTILPIYLISCDKTEDKNPPNNSNIISDSLPKSDTLNTGMEFWTKTTQNNISFEEPSGWWTTLNSLAKLGAPVTVSKTQDKHSGNYAVKLESKYWGDTTAEALLIPGLLTIGKFIYTEPFIMQGNVFSSKPNSFKGYYKYTSINGDSAVIYAKLSRYNPNKQYSDTIAETSFVIKNTVNTYQLFNLNFNYKITNQQPDTLKIVFVSSGGGENFKGQAGSTLYIDDIGFVY